MHLLSLSLTAETADSYVFSDSDSCLEKSLFSLSDIENMNHNIVNDDNNIMLNIENMSANLSSDLASSCPKPKPTLHEELYQLSIISNLTRVTVQLLLDILVRHGIDVPKTHFLFNKIGRKTK